jgi:membrane associated rhomboid family serine protease
MSGPDLFVVCKSCGSEVSPYITECPYCGNRLRKRAPKLDRPDRGSARGSRRPKAASLGRLRSGEMPGIRLDRRPYATLALLLGAFGVNLAWRVSSLTPFDFAVVGKLGSEWWRVLTAPFVYLNSGYLLVAAIGIALFGWLLERRHGPVAVLLVFLAGGAAGMWVAAALESFPVATGANGAALALLCAWAVPDLQARRRGQETDSDMLGVAVLAASLLALPLFIDDADALAGVTGALTGLLLGVGLSAFSRA